ncbi:hypothetical protein QBC34DRAFT_100652 [Podospora aff. communis PSN243]|uniref:Uncharacterized protein n=1 Tax=Podospora aff. communis PSN243 TaxID=3040156 RepID=A0AAV9GKP9_9PEZI|nr:hypothetical protein QBC34DRAFT_100652 [Podospora aff. communis PSN243]
MVAQSRLIAALAATSTSPNPTNKPCDYYNNDRCIDAKTTATAPLPFPTLFHTPPKFVYAVDELDASSKDAALRRNPASIPSTYLGTVLKAAWWLEYDQNSLNDARSQERNYYAFALETASGGEIGGDGCAGLLGERCLGNLKKLFAEKTYRAPDYMDGGLGSVIWELYSNPPEDLGCPADIFGTRWDAPNTDIPIMLGQFEPFARYGGFFVKPALPSGNASFVHGPPQFRFRSVEEQSARGVIGITVGWPVTPNFEEPSYSLADVDVETVCLRLGSAGGGQGAGELDAKGDAWGHRVDL